MDPNFKHCILHPLSCTRTHWIGDKVLLNISLFTPLICDIQAAKFHYTAAVCPWTLNQSTLTQHNQWAVLLISAQPVQTRCGTAVSTTSASLCHNISLHLSLQQKNSSSRSLVDKQICCSSLYRNYPFSMETMPLLTSDMGKKTVSVRAQSFLLTQRT